MSGKSTRKRAGKRREAAESKRSRRPFALLATLLSVLAATAVWWVLSSRTGKGSEPVEVSPQTAIPRIENLGEVDPRMAERVRQAVAAVERAPDDADVWGRLGQVYNAHGFIALAAQSYESASRLDPQSFAWPYYLAIFATDRGAVKEAVRLLETTVRLQPEYLAGQFRLGSVHLDVGNIEAARQAYERVTALAPQSPWGYVGLGSTAWREQRYEAAASLLERARELDPDIQQANYLLAMTYLALGRKQRSEELLEGLADTAPQAVLHDPLIQQMQQQRNDLQSRIAEAKQLRKQGRPEAAEAIYQAVIGYDPDHYEAHHDLGVLYARLGRHESAERHLEKATSLRPNTAAPHLNLAMLYFESSRPEQSMKETKRALELDPRLTEALRLFDALTAGLTPSSPD